MSLPRPPAGINLQDNQQPEITAAIFTTWTLAVIAVGLRFAARLLSKASLWWDDWLILPSLIIQTAQSFICGVWMVKDGGVGKHIWVAPSSTDTVFYKGLFIAEIAYATILAIAKFSILAMYWRLFNAERSVRISIYSLAVITMCLWLMMFIEAHCHLNPRTTFIGSAVPNIVTDVALLCLPVRVIWGLHSNLSQKITLTSIFLMGSLATAISIVRLAYLLNLGLTSVDFTWNFRQTLILTVVESNIVIICACLPCLRPILSLVRNSPTSSKTRSNCDRYPLAASSSFSSHRRAMFCGKGRLNHDDIIFNSLLETRVNEHPEEVNISNHDGGLAVHEMKSLSPERDGA
ncbi:hypothetical protein BO71DRAFT_433807 [Aspergillus ellipticus CBS 707.79]|uniref:Rhodopsin domain-containing protein n=1 Tax=Aspergillus ellipticus CBS 707.79 TaxID=1448320 RepID=A0A319EHR6_9EURO|nr:hypothetical protein BO71DRAFT_433807 [Aspergillus ellipticus CBS 707.79]